MLNSDTKKMVIESWYLIDFSLFKDDPKKELSETQYKEYLSNKAALLEVLFEMYGKVLHYNKNFDSRYTTYEEMFDFVEDKITILKENVIDIIKKEDVLVQLREEFQGYTREQVSSGLETKKLEFLFDLTLLSEAINNLKNPNKLKKWDYKLLYNAYKHFRTNLISYATVK